MLPVRIVLTNPNDAGKAIEQLRIARRLSPDDETIHKAFQQAARKSRDKAVIEEGWLEYIAAFPRELRLYRELGKFYERCRRPENAVRAFTTLEEFRER